MPKERKIDRQFLIDVVELLYFKSKSHAELGFMKNNMKKIKVHRNEDR